MVKKTTKKKKVEEKEEVFYVGMKNPIEIRRSLLESSKELVQYLQRAERFKKIRAEKEEEIINLKQDIHQIRILVKKLKTELPKTKLRAGHIKEAKVEEPDKEQALVVQEEEPVKTRASSDLERLEEELGEIEGRLTKLT